MKFNLLIPHFRTVEMTTYCVSKYLEYKGEHDLYIYISNNSPEIDIRSHLKPFEDNVIIVDHPTDVMHSHGTSLDRLVPIIESGYFLTAETDSFPIRAGYLDYYADLISKGIDIAGSILSLSGGQYIHPCGALYNKSVWAEANDFAWNTPYSYFPAMSMYKGFPCHLMVHNDIIDLFLEEPEDYIELADGYKPYSAGLAIEKRNHYLPTVGAFHNGMGANQEELETYGKRDFYSEPRHVFMINSKKIIRRMGYEPGQFLSYFAFAGGKKIHEIPTETKWIDGIEGGQQEYTLTENGIKHIWAGTAHLSMKGTPLNHIYEIKHKTITDLYNSLPKHQRID